MRAKLQWKRLRTINYKKPPMNEITKLKKSKSIILLDINLNEVKRFNSTTLAMKELKIGHIKFKSILDKNILLENKYYLKSSLPVMSD